MPPDESSRRVVITASGFVLPLGRDEAGLLAGLDAPHGPFVAASQDPEVAVCPIPDFDLKTHTGRFKDARYLTRGQQLCLAAAILAVELSGLDPTALDQAGLFLGLGPNLEAGPRVDKALWLLDYLPNTAAAAMAKVLGVHGENLTILTACAASTQALGQAFRAIRHGLTDVALAGGGDSRLSAPGIAAYKQAGVLATNWHRPELACRPFDRARSGFAIGEGGAMFVLESLEHAQSRGATILAEVTGAASSLDGHALTGPDPTGRAARQAVARCQSEPGAVIVAHGTGTVLNDAIEAEILVASAPLAVVAFKSRIGHLAAACGAAELALALACARRGLFPAIANLDNPQRPDLPFLREPTRLAPKTLFIQSFGFGGQNACLEVRPW